MSARDRYVRDQTSRSQDLCKHLQLLDAEEQGALGRYFLKPSLRGGFSWVEVVVLRGGSLLVHGDCDMVVFSNYHKPQNPRQVVSWIASSEYDYAEEKASIGGSVARVWDEDVVAEAVCRWRRTKAITAEQARSLLDRTKDGSQDGFYLELHSYGYYDLTHERFGMVTAPRVFAAQAVLRRLNKLLGESA